MAAESELAATCVVRAGSPALDKLSNGPLGRTSAPLARVSSNPLSLKPELKEVRLALCIVDQDGERACCKSDGLRFSGGADTTVKLCADMVYRLQLSSGTQGVSFKGPALIRTRRAECYEPGVLESCCGLRGGGAGAVKYANMNDLEWSEPRSAPLAERSEGGGGGGGGGASGGGAGGRSVDIEWQNDMELTGRGYRGELELEFEIADYGTVRLPLQAKIYSMSDTSAQHGVTLRSVEYLLVKSGITQDIRVLQTQYIK